MALRADGARTLALLTRLLDYGGRRGLGAGALVGELAQFIVSVDSDEALVDWLEGSAEEGEGDDDE